MEGVAQTFHTLIQTLAFGGTSLKNLECSVFQFVETKGRVDLCHAHCPLDVLLVSEHYQDGILELLLQHRDKLLLADPDPVPVSAVHHVDNGVGVGVITSPVWSNACLTSEIPHLELEIFVDHRLDIEADGGDGGDHLSGLESVQDGRLAGAIKTQDQDSHLFGANQVPEVAEQTSHDVCVTSLSLSDQIALQLKFSC